MLQESPYSQTGSMNKAAAAAGADSKEPQTPLSNKSHKIRQHNNLVAPGRSARSIGNHKNSSSTALQVERQA